MEKETELKIFKVQMFCDCGGEMEPRGFALLSNPAEYPHKCALCGAEKTYKEQYPAIKYRAVENG